MTTALIVHSFSTFYFTYFYHYKQKPQPPHLELLRMALVCLPVIIVLIGAWQAKREDVRMNADTKIPYYDGQAESMLGRNSVDFRNMAAYDVDGRKVVDCVEAVVISDIKGTQAPVKSRIQKSDWLNVRRVALRRR